MILGWISGNPAYTVHPTNPKDSYQLHHYSRQTSIVTVVVIWCYAIGVTVIIAIVYFTLTNVQWISDLGRHTRSRADTQMENILSHLSRIALEHQTDVHGKTKWILGSKATGEEEEE